MYTRSAGMSGESRRTVAARSASSATAPSGKSCFGRSARDAGQNRVPAPPAMITAKTPMRVVLAWHLRRRAEGLFLARLADLSYRGSSPMPLRLAPLVALIVILTALLGCERATAPQLIQA